MKHFLTINDEYEPTVLKEPSELAFIKNMYSIPKNLFDMIYGIFNSHTYEETHGAVTSALLKLKSPSLQRMMLPKYIDTVSTIISNIKYLEDNFPDDKLYPYFFLYGIFRKTTTQANNNFTFAFDILNYYQDIDDALAKESINNLTVVDIPSLERVYMVKKGSQQNLELMRGYNERIALYYVSDDTDDTDIPVIYNRDEDMKTIGGVVFFLNALNKLPMIAHYAYVRCSADNPWISKEDNAVNSSNYKSLYKYCNQPTIFLKSKTSAENIRYILREQFGIKNKDITKVFNDVLNKKNKTEEDESK